MASVDSSPLVSSLKGLELDACDASGLMSRRNALPDVLDETVTKVSAGQLVTSLTKLHSGSDAAVFSSGSAACGDDKLSAAGDDQKQDSS